jgi:hypothetical protein
VVNSHGIDLIDLPWGFRIPGTRLIDPVNISMSDNLSQEFINTIECELESPHFSLPCAPSPQKSKHISWFVPHLGITPCSSLSHGQHITVDQDCKNR